MPSTTYKGWLSLATERTPRMLTLADDPAPEELWLTCIPADLPASERIRFGDLTAVSCEPLILSAA